MDSEDGASGSLLEERSDDGTSGDLAVASSLENAPTSGPLAEFSHTHGTSATPLTIISKWGDLILCFGEDASQASTRRWQVASTDLIRNSPYFRALLDPNKFREGRHLMKQKKEHDARYQGAKQDAHGDSARNQAVCLRDDDELPMIRLPGDSMPRRLAIEAMDLFLRILSFESADGGEDERFIETIRHLSSSAVASLVEVADIFNSPQPVRNILQRAGYSYGKSKTTFSRFSSVYLKMSEDRIRQIILIAVFLNDQGVVQTLTHSLIILGSRYWRNGVGIPSAEEPRWRFLPGALEGTASPCLKLSPYGLFADFQPAVPDEMYYRRQCVLHTITDLQAYFLRVYGALEEPADGKRTGPAASSSSLSNIRSIQPRSYQCRWAFENSSACDAFHLGQMIRFFSLRTKTIFFGSTLIDPDLSIDYDDEDRQDDDENAHVATEHAYPAATGPTSDLLGLIASLKQCPDYQIDPSHSGCGIRRRLVPALDCIEGFLGDARRLLGIALRTGDTVTPQASSSWRNRTRRRADVVELRFSKLQTVRPASIRSGSHEDDARLFFTARKRHWEV